MTAAPPIRIGTSGWSYADWRPGFYPLDLPKTKWLSYYTSAFNAVELNTTFYGLPLPAVFNSWTSQTLAGFKFAVKAPRALTHERKGDSLKVLDPFLERCRLFGQRLGPLLYQLPPWQVCDVSFLDSFVGVLPSALVHVVEFRHASWYTPEVKHVLAKSGIGFCQHDMKGSSTPDWVTARIAYRRLHGTQGKYRGQYGLTRLQSLAEKVKRQAGAVDQSFVFFNNTVVGDAAREALILRDLLQS